METFSDAVIAIVITIMVLELPIPHGTNWDALHDALPVLLAYVLSFINAVGRDLKGKLSPLLYATGIGLSLLSGWLGVVIYAGVALIWLIPDPRLERTVARQSLQDPDKSDH